MAKKELVQKAAIVAIRGKRILVSNLVRKMPPTMSEKWGLQLVNFPTTV